MVPPPRFCSLVGPGALEAHNLPIYLRYRRAAKTDAEQVLRLSIP